jgi:ribosomal protein S18 acetylase RimI-like enzyme
MSQPGITIRLGVLDDLDILTNFAVAMAYEIEKENVDRDQVKEATCSALADAAKALYFVAELGGEIVGSLMVTYEWSDWQNANYWWIQSVYVMPSTRRKGVYRALYDHVSEEARRVSGVASVKLYVYEGNEIAQQTYEALGMSKAPYYIYESVLPQGCN